MFTDFLDKDDNKTINYTIPPYVIMLTKEQFECVTPLVEGWHGHLYIFQGACTATGNIQDFAKVYYRVADTLPFCKPVE